MNSDISFVATYAVEGIKNYATIADVVGYCGTKTVLGLDIETTRKYSKTKYKEGVYKGGLDPFLSEIVMLQIGDAEKVFVIDIRCFSKTDMQPLLDLLDFNEKIMFVGVNLKFEGKHLKHRYGIHLRNVWDAMICEINLTNGLSEQYSLADLAVKYLGVAKKKENQLFEKAMSSKQITLNDEYLEEQEYAFTPYEIADEYQIDKSTRLEFLNIGIKPFNEKQILYGADDVIFPILIRERQMVGRMLMNKSIYRPTKLHRVENLFTQVLATVELAGMDFDQEEWLKIATSEEAIYKDRLDKLNKYVARAYPSYGTQYDLFTPQSPSCVVDWASSQKVVLTPSPFPELPSIGTHFGSP